MIDCRIQHEPIDLAAELVAVEAAGAGAIASFTGIVRGDDGVSALELEHYPGMTEAALTGLAEAAAERWALIGATIVHRVGVMVPGDRVVLVATAARHRHAALDACAFLIDRLKTEAPFWKRERRGDETKWVAPRDSDGIAASRWRDADGKPQTGGDGRSGRAHR